MIQFEALAPGNLEPMRIQSQLMQDRRVDVGDVMPILDGMKAKFIGGAVLNTSRDTAPGQPRAKTLRMMIAAALLRAGRTSEFRAKHDQRFVEQAALF
jgi:hypothetical protein